MKNTPPSRPSRRRRNGPPRERGQALVEFALLLPVILMVLFLVIDFGVGISRWIVVTNAAREAARLGASGEPDSDVIKAKAVDTGAKLLTPDDVTVTYRDSDGNGDADRGDSVKVNTTYEYRLITPLKALLDLGSGSITLKGCADMRLEVPLPGVAAVSMGEC